MKVGSSRNDHTLTVYAFLGSATFTTLFFLLQSKDLLKYYDLFVPITAITSILFILAVVGRLQISNGNISSRSHYGAIVNLFVVVGFVLILSIIALLVMEVNFVLGIITGIFTLTLYIILDVTYRKSR